MQTFNDGIVSIYTLGNVANEGDMPQEGLTFKTSLRYAERTVGMGRFWTAQQAQAKIDLLLRTSQIREVSTQDIAITNSKQYRIMQIQYPEATKVMDMSLERLEQDYAVN